MNDNALDNTYRSQAREEALLAHPVPLNLKKNCIINEYDFVEHLRI